MATRCLQLERKRIIRHLSVEVVHRLDGRLAAEVRRDAVRTRDEHFDIIDMHRLLYGIERTIENSAILLKIYLDALIHRRAICIHLLDIRFALRMHHALMRFGRLGTFNSRERNTRCKPAECRTDYRTENRADNGNGNDCLSERSAARAAKLLP